VKRISIVAAVIAVATLPAVAPDSHAVPAPSSPTEPAERPNFVVVMTDDQDLASLEYMPHVQELLVDEGVSFKNHTVVFPLCCPSRSGYLSGQVGHNNNVRGNGAPDGGYGNLNTAETFPVWLSGAGYATEHIGKYPNGYDGSQHSENRGVPEGWTEWHGAVDPTTYLFYGYVFNEDGVNVPHGWTEADYQTDVVTGIATDFIYDHSESGDPFVLDVAYLAPHWEFKPGTATDKEVGDIEGGSGESSIGMPPEPAKRHKGMFQGMKAPRRPSFNEEDVSDKPSFVQDTAPLTQGEINQVDRWYRKRLQSLQAVDEGVAQIVDTLEATGELDNTYIAFVADNGWLQGEHRLALQKTHAYAESATGPLVVRGPGVAEGGVVTDKTSHIDLTATILDVTGVEPVGHELDGMPLTPYLSNPDLHLGRAVFMETAPGNGGYYAVKTDRWKYVEYNNGDMELYDLVADPFELESLHEDPIKTDLIAELSARLEAFRTCAGADCIVTGVD
jgi:N-acetylglucosamine-6-sulfatase